MEINIVRGVTILGYVIMVAGICSLGYAIYMPASDMSINHVTEFNQTYAEAQSSDPLPIIGSEEKRDNIEPLEVHLTINESEMEGNNSDVLREIVGTNETVLIDRPNQLPFERFIVAFDYDNYQVYNSVPDSPTKTQLSVVGIIMSFTGFLIVSNMRASSAPKLDTVTEQDDGKWDYYIDDED